MDIITNIINLFGLEGKIFVAQIVNFVVLLIILKLFLYEPIAKMLEERSNKIKQGLDDAENAKKALLQADSEKTAVLKAAKADADKIIENTKVSAESLKQKSLQETKKQSAEIVDNAKRLAKEEFDKAEKQIGNMSADISEKIVAKILSELFSEEEKSSILSRAVEKIENGNYGK